MKKIFTHTLLGLSLTGIGLLTSSLYAVRTSLDDKMEHCVAAFLGIAAPAVRAEAGAAAAEAFEVRKTDNFTPLTRAQKESFLACTNWEKAHGHDAADAAFKARIADQLEDDSVTSFNLFETFTIWAADCTGTTAEAWLPDDQDFLRSFSEEEIAAALNGEKKDPLTLTPQEAARVVMRQLHKSVARMHRVGAQSLFNDPLIFLPCLNKTGHFAPDRLTHSLLNNIFLVGIPSNGGATHVHGDDLSPISQMQHDINHGLARLRNLSGIAKESAERVLNTLSAFKELSDEAKKSVTECAAGDYVLQEELFSNMLDHLNEVWRKTDERLPIAGLFWMLHETGGYVYPAIEILREGLQSTLDAFIDKTVSGLSVATAQSAGTSFVTGKLLDPEALIQPFITMARELCTGLYLGDTSGAKFVSEGDGTRFVWEIGGYTAFSAEVRTNLDLTQQVLEGMNTLLAWAGSSHAQPLPENTGDEVADEAMWQRYADHTLEAAKLTLEETKRAATLFFETDEGKTLEAEFQTHLADLRIGCGEAGYMERVATLSTALAHEKERRRTEEQLVLQAQSGRAHLEEAMLVLSEQMDTQVDHLEGENLRLQAENDHLQNVVKDLQRTITRLEIRQQTAQERMERDLKAPLSEIKRDVAALLCAAGIPRNLHTQTGTPN